MATWIDIGSDTGVANLYVPYNAPDPDYYAADRRRTLTSSWAAFIGIESASLSLERAAQLCRRSVDHVRREIVPAAAEAGVLKIWNQKPLGIAFAEREFVDWFRTDYRREANERKTAHFKRRTVGGMILGE